MSWLLIDSFGAWLAGKVIAVMTITTFPVTTGGKIRVWECVISYIVNDAKTVQVVRYYKRDHSFMTHIKIASFFNLKRNHYCFIYK